MGRINSRSKGAAGEHEAIKWIARNIGLTGQRNLEQVRSGGHDIIDVQPFCFEIKRVESLALRAWWLQVTRAVDEEYREPVVMFRQNRKTWRFLISAKEIGIEKGYILLEEREFKLWAKGILAIPFMRTGS